MAIVFDGQIFDSPADVPDMGSIECVGSEGYRRFYSGLSADMPGKLPTYDNLATDSTAKALDTGQFFYYHAPTKTWYEQ